MLYPWPLNPRVLHENWEEIYHLFATHWVQTCREEVDESHCGREALVLVRIWVAHTPLAIQFAKYMLYTRMLQYISTPISEVLPHSIRATDEGVVDLARACISPLEIGRMGFITVSFTLI